MKERTPSYTDNALTLGTGTFISRLLGFARDAAIAALLGGGWVADALLLAIRLPNLFRTLLTEGAFAYTLVPVCRKLWGENPARAHTFIRTLSLTLFLALSLLAALGAVFSTQAALLLAPGFASSPDILHSAAACLALCLAYLPLAAGAAVYAAALMSLGRFTPPAYASAVFNAVLLFTAGAAFISLGAGDARAPYALCAGVILAGLAQWGYQAFFLHTGGFSPRGPVTFTNPALFRALAALPRSLFGAGGHQVNILLATFFASFLAEGAISALYFAERLVAFPLGVIAVSVGLAALPGLTGLAPAAGSGPETAARRAAFTETLAGAVRVTLFFALPAAAGAACLALPLAEALFGRGAFGAEALARTTHALLAYLPGLPALAIIRPLLAGFGATGDTETPMRAAFAGLAATAVFGALSLLSGAAWGPALAVSLAAWVNAAALVHILAKRNIMPLPSRSWFAKILASCFVMSLCVLWAAHLFASAPAKIATVPVGVAAYFALAALLRVEEAVRVMRMVRAKVAGNRNAQRGTS